MIISPASFNLKLNESRIPMKNIHTSITLHALTEYFYILYELICIVVYISDNSEYFRCREYVRTPPVIQMYRTFIC